MTAPLARLSEVAVRLAGRFDIDPDRSFARDVALLGWGVDPERLLAASYAAATLCTLLGLVLVVGPFPTGVGLGPLLVGGLLGVGTPRLTRWLADVRRTRALGAVPDLCCRLVVRMRVSPSVERATDFAARGEGPLARELAAATDRARGTPETGLSRLAVRWGDRLPALTRMATLVETAAAEPTDRRDRLLDRAMDSVVEATRDRMARFAAGLRGPTTALYAFGVLLPLALVAVLPAARAAGLVVSLSTVVVVYDLVLPLGLVVASAWLLGRRPVAFPAPAAPVREATPRWRLLALPMGAVAGVLAGGITIRALPAWTPSLAAPAIGLGVALIAWFRPDVYHYRHVRAVEAGLPDALALVGRRVSDGEPVEAALASAASATTGPTGDVLAAAVGRQRRLRVDVTDALLGRYGVLTRLNSPRARSTAALLGVAARQGSPAGDALVTMADHLSALRAVDRETRRELGQVTATLTNTASVFGPLVAGTTVALADAITLPGVATPVGSGIETAGLGLAVGGYVLLLAVVLTVLSTGLERTLDPAVVGTRVGRALVVATVVYLVAFGVTTTLT